MSSRHGLECTPLTVARCRLAILCGQSLAPRANCLEVCRQAELSWIEFLSLILIHTLTLSLEVACIQVSVCPALSCSISRQAEASETKQARQFQSDSNCARHASVVVVKRHCDHFMMTVITRLMI